MRISEVKVLLVKGDEVLKAYVSIKIEDSLLIRDIKVIKSNSGYFVAMPTKKMKDGTYWDLVHPLDSSTRNMLEERVLSEYHKVFKRPEPTMAAAPGNLKAREARKTGKNLQIVKIFHSRL